MHFKLGKWGEDGLQRMLQLSDHPEIDTIREGVKRAQNAENYWRYKHPEFKDVEPTADAPEEPDQEERPSPEPAEPETPSDPVAAPLADPITDPEPEETE